MPANITSVTVCFGNGLKREEYGPVKKAEVSITASVAEDEDGAVVLALIGTYAIAKVADMLSAPKPETATALETVDAEVIQPGEAPARRTRGPAKSKAATSAETPAFADTEALPADAAATEPSNDEWEAGADDIVITDAELLSATSKRAGELGAREPIVKLIATFATRTEGAPFKVQEIPAAQRKDYLTKLAALAA